MIQLEAPYDEGPSTNDQYDDQHSQSSSDKIPQMVSTSKRHNTLIETPSPTTDRKHYNYNSKPIITKVQRHEMSRESNSIPIILSRNDDDTSYSKMKDLESSDRWREDNSSNLFCCWYDYIDELIYNTFSNCTPIHVCIDDGVVLLLLFGQKNEQRRM